MSEKIQAISKEQLDFYRNSADSTSAAARAVARVGLFEAGLNQDVLRKHDFNFSVETKMGDITNQKASGRCWMFAAMNAARIEVMKKLKLKTFDFSKVYPLFWDKLEKSNYFLESILKTMDEPLDGRLLQHLLKDPIQDGGQWDMYLGLLEKYGAVPNSAMPETFHSSNTNAMARLITRRLRAFACELRKAHEEDKASLETLRSRKQEMLKEIYQILVNCLGTPPETFRYAYRDEDKNYHVLPKCTPKEFFDEFVGWDLKAKRSLINAPTADKPMGQVYTVQFLGTVIEAEPIRYLNVPMDVLKTAAIESLKAGEPVWFGCDVGQHLLNKEGIMDLDSIDYTAVAGKEPAFSKAERLDYGESVLTHAMVFTGVDLDENGKPLCWKVENSWSEKSGNKGIYSMSDAWFDEYNYEIMVDEKFIPDEYKKLFEQPLVELKPWDPMGALAK